MTVKKYTILLVSLLLPVTATSAKAKLPKEQVCTLFNQANQDFRQANSTEGSGAGQKTLRKSNTWF